MTHEPVVVVGAGLAGAKTVQALREQDYTGELVLIGAEPDRPYERPPLSKEYLNGKAERDSVFVHPLDWYDEHDVRLLLDQPAVAAGPTAVTLRDGSTCDYGTLVLATGSRPRTLPVPGGDHPAVLTLRTLADSDRLRRTLADAEHLLIVGAGWIGLEAAAAARAAGVAVTVVEAAELPLLRVLGPEIARSFADLHTANGVTLRLGAQLAEITVEGDRASGVRLGDGTVLSADAVLVGVGVQPNVELADGLGLSVDNGVLVDEHLRSSQPDVFAVGDVANAWHPLLQARVRVEHWANALNQPAVAAANILGGQQSYDRLPYFYTDQYDLGMEYVGHVGPDGYDELVIRGDLENRQYLAFWLRAGRVLAGMNVNVWDVVSDVRGLINSGAAVDRARLADPGVALAETVTR